MAYIEDSKSSQSLVDKHYKINLYKLDVARLPGILATTMKRMD